MNLRAYYARLIRLAVLLGALALLLAGCDLPWQAKQSDLAKDQTLKMGWNTGGGPDITTLDPAQCADPSCIALMTMLYDGLVTIDRHEHVEPWAARSWTISADGLTYTFRSQSNQRFSDGAPVTASDFAWSIDRSANPCLGTQLSYYLATIKDASAFSGETCTSGQPVGAITSLVGDSVIPDDSANTLTIKLAQPAGYFLAPDLFHVFCPREECCDRRRPRQRRRLAQYSGQGRHGPGRQRHVLRRRVESPGRADVEAEPPLVGAASGKKPNFTTVDFKLFSSTDTEYSTYQTDQTLAYTDTIPVDPDRCREGAARLPSAASADRGRAGAQLEDRPIR